MRNITLLGAALDGSLGILKVVFGILGNSQALVADGVHSFSDLFSDFVVLFAVKHSSQKADHSHPYGHGRIETLATVFLAIILLGVAIGILWNAVAGIFQQSHIATPTSLTLVLAIISVASKELIYQFTIRVAHRIKSKLLEANAWHSRSDALSSIIVIIGILGTWAGWIYLDAIAAIIVGFIIAKVAWDIGWPAANELIDTAVDDQEREKLTNTIASVEGVINLHMLRTRSVGDTTFLDVHVQVAPTISVSEGHEIGERIRRKISIEMGQNYDLTLHIDPEDDAATMIGCIRPSRADIIADLENIIGINFGQPDAPALTVHYLSNHVDLDLIYDTAPTPMQLPDSAIKAINAMEYVGNIQVLVKTHHKEAH